MLSYIFDRLPIDDAIDTLSFSLSGNFRGNFYSGIGVVEGKSSDRIVFSIPQYNDSVFFALTRSDASHVARILANLEDYERETGNKLNFGEIIDIPASNEKMDDLCSSVMILRTATAPYLRNVPDKEVIGGNEINFLFAIPLSRDEVIFRNNFGHDRLMDEFAKTSKNIFF